MSTLSTDPFLIQVQEYATKAHEGQTRKDGVTPYITHPIGVAKLVARIGGSTEQIAIALLHDVIEDCDGYEYETILEEFGKEIADGVRDLTNTSKLDRPELNRAARKALDNERLRTIPMESKEVKLCDIYYNVHDLKGLDSGFVPKFLREKDRQLAALFDTDEDQRDPVVVMLIEAIQHIQKKLRD